jgi:hypothetical protein
MGSKGNLSLPPSPAPSDGAFLPLYRLPAALTVPVRVYTED